MLTVDNLIKLGLTKNQAIIYYFLTKKSKSTFTEICIGTDTKNATLDKASKSLIELGLIEKMVVGLKKYYFITSPKKLKAFVDNQEFGLNAKEKLLNSIKKQLQITYDSNVEGNPRVRFFNGVDGLKEHWKRVINKKVSLLKQVVNYDLTIFSQDKKNVEQKRKLFKDIKLDIIFTAKEKPINIAPDEIYASYKEHKNITAEIAIYDDSVLFISGGVKKTGLLIEDKNIVDTMNVLHKMAKDSLKNN